MTVTPSSLILPHLPRLLDDAAAEAASLASAIGAAVSGRVLRDGRVDRAAVDAEQHAAHGLAWAAAYAETLRQTAAWAHALEAEGRLTEAEALPAQLLAHEYLSQLQGGVPMNQGEIFRPADVLVPAERLAHRGALPHEPHAVGEAATRDADAHRGDRQPRTRRDAERLAVALDRLLQVAEMHLRLREVQGRRRARELLGLAPQHLAVRLALAQVVAEMSAREREAKPCSIDRRMVGELRDRGLEDLSSARVVLEERVDLREVEPEESVLVVLGARAHEHRENALAFAEVDLGDRGTDEALLDRPMEIEGLGGLGIARALPDRRRSIRARSRRDREHERDSRDERARKALHRAPPLFVFPAFRAGRGDAASCFFGAAPPACSRA